MPAPHPRITPADIHAAAETLSQAMNTPELNLHVDQALSRLHADKRAAVDRCKAQLRANRLART